MKPIDRLSNTVDEPFARVYVWFPLENRLQETVEYKLIQYLWEVLHVQSNLTVTRNFTLAQLEEDENSPVQAP